MSFSNYALDTFVAPRLSELRGGSPPTLADVPAEYDQARFWVRKFILGSMLLFTMLDEHRKYVLNFLRRAESAFAAYGAGRTHLTTYLASPRNTISEYFAAVVAFETATSQAYQAFALLGKLLERKLYESDDGTALQRLAKLYVHNKHAEGMIAGGQLPEGFTIPVWIERDGLACGVAKVTFDELAELLRELGKSADMLSSPPA